ncbi:MAG TPA: MFS transporter [Streptosporangiaceae bacterium]|nr:MFS transporter [Streptosporangiaceae bacterium]
MGGYGESSGGEFAALDQSRITRFQWKIMFVSGMGFFTDAYDLFVIGIVVALIKPEWGLSTGQVSLLNSVTLAASAVGAIIFGRVADILGRKRIYGYEVLILALGALASALAPSFWWLLVFRAILGIGIGGDYPVSATIMSEYSGTQTRGKMVGLVFAMQGAGLVIGPLLASGLLASGLSNEVTWRVLLAAGAIPGLAVFYLRRRIHETPRFAAAGGATEEAEAAIAAATGGEPGRPRRADRVAGDPRPPSGESRARSPQSALAGFRTLVRYPRMLTWLIGAAGAWALLDFCYYGNSISAPEILALLNPAASLLHNTLIQLAIFAIFAVPGYIAAILLLDKTGRKRIQVLGFAIMALMFVLIGAIPAVTAYAMPFIVLYGISYFFTQFGPNTTTFVYPAEIFPVDVRTTGHGIAAGAGKLGAFAGAFLFPDMLASSLGIRGAEIIAGVVAMAGLLLTVFLLPEPRGRSLEDLAQEARAPARAALERAA